MKDVRGAEKFKNKPCAKTHIDFERFTPENKKKYLEQAKKMLK